MIVYLNAFAIVNHPTRPGRYMQSIVSLQQSGRLTHDTPRVPWNKGKITGQKPPLKRNEIWAIRVHLQIRRRTRDLALFNLAIDSKLSACDLVRIRVRDVTHGGQVSSRAISCSDSPCCQRSHISALSASV